MWAAETETLAESEEWARKRALLSAHPLGPKERQSLLSARRVFATASNQTTYAPFDARRCASMSDALAEQAAKTPLWLLWMNRVNTVDCVGKAEKDATHNRAGKAERRKVR